MFHPEASCFADDTKLTLLTPIERERIIQRERQKRRIARLMQVRVQGREQAQKIRKKIAARKAAEMGRIRDRVKRNIRREKTEAIANLRTELEANLHQMGEAHREALREPDFERIRAVKDAENAQRAAHRQKEAFRREVMWRKESEEQSKAVAERRKEAVVLANVRSRVAHHVTEQCPPLVRLESVTGANWHLDGERQHAGMDRSPSPISRETATRRIPFDEID